MNETTQNGTIVVTRSSNDYQDSLRSIRLHVDGQVIGLLARGESKSLSAAPGEHRVRCTVDWSGSPEVVVTVRAGVTTSLHVRSNPDYGAIRKMLSRTKWLQLTERHDL
ncbi:hypothetical protein [Solicola sp. PLA-1-18]|uniref:hypothetical protein n=1 Tax=Solicola sp. PLA-1-18 TaxID=3380532 RepID=UPI003B7F4B1A